MGRRRRSFAISHRQYLPRLSHRSSSNHSVFRILEATKDEQPSAAGHPEPPKWQYPRILRWISQRSRGRYVEN